MAIVKFHFGDNIVYHYSISLEIILLNISKIFGRLTLKPVVPEPLVLNIRAKTLQNGQNHISSVLN